jgi:hypothetical protein
MKPLDILQTALWWCSGTSAEDMRRLPERSRRQQAALGLLILGNFLVGAGAWMKVGWLFIGPVGLVLPGVVVPAMVIFGLDRLLAMRPRRLTRELAEMEPEPNRDERHEIRARAAMAGVFGLLTTFVLMLTLSMDAIRDHETRRAAAVNQPLRAEYEQRALAPLQIMQAQVDERMALVRSERETLVARLQSARDDATAAEAAGRAADDEAAREDGGLEGKLRGQGDRFRAQKAIAGNNRAAAARARDDAAQAERRIAALDAESAELAARVARAQAESQAQMANVDARMKADPRHVVPREDLFSTTGAFIALYADPQQGAGRWLLTLILLPVCVGLECAALLGITAAAPTPLDVLRMAGNRAVAAEIVAEESQRVADAHARMPLPQVVPRPEPPPRGRVGEGAFAPA